MQADEENENHWPGYVDALTTMTMMLIFVMMILSIALYGLSENVSRSIVEKIARAAGVTVDATTSGADEIARQVTTELEARQRRDPQPARQDAPAQDSQRHATPPDPPLDRPADREGLAKLTAPVEGVEKTIDASQGALTRQPIRIVDTTYAASLLTLNFQPRATSVDDLAGEDIRKFVATRGLGESGARFELRAYARMDGGPVSDPRRVAYYRAMAVRSRLIAIGVEPARISVNLVERTGDPRADRVEIAARVAGAPQPAANAP